jgi:hypothetical protein
MGHHISLRHLRYVIAAAEQGSFRRAAQALGVQESAISRRIRDLKDEIGVALFQAYDSGQAGVRLDFIEGGPSGHVPAAPRPLTMVSNSMGHFVYAN